jgi:hypothetical protein
LGEKYKVVTLEARVQLVGREGEVGNRGGWESNEGHRVLLAFLNFEFWTFRGKWG